MHNFFLLSHNLGCVVVVYIAKKKISMIQANLVGPRKHSDTRVI